MSDEAKNKYEKRLHDEKDEKDLKDLLFNPKTPEQKRRSSVVSQKERYDFANISTLRAAYDPERKISLAEYYIQQMLDFSVAVEGRMRNDGLAWQQYEAEQAAIDKEAIVT